MHNIETDRDISMIASAGERDNPQRIVAKARWCLIRYVLAVIALACMFAGIRGLNGHFCAIGGECPLRAGNRDGITCYVVKEHTALNGTTYEVVLVNATSNYNPTLCGLSIFGILTPIITFLLTACCCPVLLK